MLSTTVNITKKHIMVAKGRCTGLCPGSLSNHGTANKVTKNKVGITTAPKGMSA
jgi:hypothetical protein